MAAGEVRQLSVVVPDRLLEYLNHTVEEITFNQKVGDVPSFGLRSIRVYMFLVSRATSRGFCLTCLCCRCWLAGPVFILLHGVTACAPSKGAFSVCCPPGIPGLSQLGQGC